MCHELWLGGRSSLPLRQRFIGRVQRTAILNMLRGLGGEAVVHTSNAHYQNRLQRGGIENVRVLPLFGNVPVGNRVGDGWLFSRLNKEGITIDKESRVRHWVGGFFGSLQQDGWAAEPLLGCLSRTADLHRRRLVLLSGGRIGGAGSAEWDRLKSSYAGQIDFLRLGEMEPEQLSQYLNSLDFGLASTRLSVIGKSGTVTAMLEHGIPVLCGSVDLPLAAGTGIENDIRAQELLFRYDQPDFEDRLAMGLPRMESKSRLGEIAARMLEDLNDGQRRPSL